MSPLFGLVEADPRTPHPRYRSNQNSIGQLVFNIKQILGFQNEVCQSIRFENHSTGSGLPSRNTFRIKSLSRVPKCHLTTHTCFKPFLWKPTCCRSAGPCCWTRLASNKNSHRQRTIPNPVQYPECATRCPKQTCPEPLKSIRPTLAADRSQAGLKTEIASLPQTTCHKPDSFFHRSNKLKTDF